MMPETRSLPEIYNILLPRQRKEAETNPRGYKHYQEMTQKDERRYAQERNVFKEAT